ncbi:MAG: hypothetical protein ACRED1_06645, partial [Limisphaerales bacterium]
APASGIHPDVATAPAAPAASGAPSANPYESIVARNVFGLNPIPPSAPVEVAKGPPPPKITLTGITTIFGPPEALFKVAGVVRNGGRPQDESYIFTEGEEQDDVEVTKIDTDNKMVTFINHGVQQDIKLSSGVASAGSGPAAPTWPGRTDRPLLRRFDRFGASPGGFHPQSYGGGFHPAANNNGSSSYNASSSGYNNAFGGVNYGGAYNGNTANSASSQPILSPDDQAAVIAAEHAEAVKQGNPMAAIFPPTPYDNQATAAAGSGASGGGAPMPTPVPPGGLRR